MAPTSRAWWSVVWPALVLATWLATPVPRAAALDPRRSLTQYQTRNWGPDKGLPCNNVLSVTQAADGYLWLGTEEGLVRFDGARARIFDRQSDPILSANSVASVVEDARHPGQLLLNGAGGLCRWVGGRIHALPSDDVPASLPGSLLFQDPVDGACWVRTARGLFRVAPDGEATGPAEAASGWPAEKIRAVCRDRRGRLWVGTARGLHRQHGDGNDGESPRFDLLPGWAGKEVDVLVPARDGGLWVGSRDAGTGRLDEDGAFHPYPALTGCLVNVLLEDRAGMLWVGTNGSGLFRPPADYDEADAGLTATVLTTANGLVHNVINDLCEDREGNLWVATQGGLQVLRDARFVNYGRPEGLSGNDVRAVFEDAHGRLWIGHENGLGELDSRDGGGVTNHSLPPSPHRPGNGRVLCLGRGDDDESLWVGTDAGLAGWSAGKMGLLAVREDLDRATVRALCLDGEGGHWVGTDSGLYRVRGGEVLAHLTRTVGLASDVVCALHADRRGNLWIATDGGLSRRGVDGQIVNFLNAGVGQANTTVLSFFEDPAHPDELFVGTEFGLHRLRATGAGDGAPKITRYTTREGLFDDVVWGVLGDGRGNLWMSSNRGISRVARTDLERFDRGEIPQVPHVAYGMADGMRSRECNGGYQSSAWQDQRGRLWFATVEGATVVDPAHVEPNPLPPPVQVEELLADGQVVLPAATADAFLPPLAPGTQKLDFRYTALSLTAPDLNRFRYRLEGFDAKWTEANAERTAHYTNLPPGRYRFCVQAANADGLWNEQGAAIAFHLQPFFYQTAWFRALVLGAVVALLWASQHGLRRRWQGRLARAEAELRERRHNQEILRQAKLEAEGERRVAEQARAGAEAARVEAERANEAKGEFLSRLSHELRTPLNAILGFGQLLELDAQTSSQRESVRHILGGGRHLLDLVNEILDLVSVQSGENPVRAEPIELASLLAEAAALIEPLAQEFGVSLRVESAVADGHALADRQRLKQVVLNLLANAVKYNRPVGGEVTIGVEEAPSGEPGVPRRRIYVRDTGAGIDAAGLAKLFTPFERLGAAYGPVEGTGLGLTVSKQLMEAMGGTIGVESLPGTGSTFWVELPAAEPPSVSSPPGPGMGEILPPTFPSKSHGDHLLYIEDHPSNRDLLESILVHYRPDLRLRFAPDGHSGLDAARKPPQPDFILLDLQLPDLSGDEVLNRLRADPVTAGIPVVVLSADVTASSRARLRAAGATDFITKPLEVQGFLHLLAERLPVSR